MTVAPCVLPQLLCQMLRKALDLSLPNEASRVEPLPCKMGMAAESACRIMAITCTSSSWVYSRGAAGRDIRNR